MNELWDRLGISASVLCILHCLLTPVLVLAMPLVGGFLSEQWFHAIIAIIIFPVAIFALWRGFRIHRLRRTVVLGGLGLICVLFGMTHGYSVGRAHPESEVVLMILGGSLLALAHYFNLRACRAHSHH
jgi:uncharacterized membrane protein YvlD (DUF360 family)